MQVIHRVLNSADRTILQGSVVSGSVNLEAALAGSPTGPLNDDFANARDLGNRSVTSFGNNQLATKDDHGFGGVFDVLSGFSSWCARRED